MLFAYNGDAQNKSIKQTHLSLFLENAPLKTVFAEIESRTNFEFTYEEKDLNSKLRLDIDKVNASLEEILMQVSQDANLKFKRVNQNIHVSKRKSREESVIESLLLVQQSKLVTGTIADENGEGIPGVNVIIKGSATGTVSSPNGAYSIEVGSSSDILMFSSVGYVTKEITVGNQSVIDVTLTPDITSLEEIVVVGYGTVKKSDLTGSVASLKPDNFNKGVNLAPENLMRGKIAGVNIVQSSGRPGATSTIRIRGSSSISAGNDPLYVIDGIPMQFTSANEYVNVTGETGTSPFSSEGSNPLNVINPSDIESIEILKDASAAAIYGSRGANGVILITTKSKKTHRETLSYDGYFGVSSIRKELPFLSADEYRNYAESNSLAYPDEGANTNWQDEIFRKAQTQNHNVSFGGSSESTNYRASLGYTKLEGILLSSELEKYTSRLNANHTALDGKLDIGLNLMYANINNEEVPVSSNIGNEGGNMLKDGLRWAPTLPVRNPDGSYYQIGELRINPVSWTDITDERITNNFIGSMNFTYKIVDPLSFRVNLGYTDEAIERYTYVPASHPLGEAESGRAAISKLKNYSTTIETTLNYNQDLLENSNINAVFGYSFYRYVTQNTYTQANQFVSDATKWNLMQSGNILSNTSYKSANRLASVFGRVNLKFQDRYLVTFTLRKDGSSRFGENNKWGLFPSGAVAWNISNESFLDSKLISDLKLRVGYGVTGNQEIPDNLYREQLTVNGSSIYVLGGKAIPSVLPSNYANPDLRWEETSQLDIGLDWSLAEGRISGTMDFYKKNTTDLLLEFSTVAPSVVETQWANVGEIENKGFEFTLDGIIIDNNDLRWNANLNFSRNVNEVLSLSNDQLSREEIRRGPRSGVVAVEEGENTQIIKPGLPLGTFYGWKFTGLDENGMETYLDEDGDGFADEVVIGNANPDFTFGFSNSLSWKQFDVSLTFIGVMGNDIFNNTAAEFSYTSTTPGVNVLSDALARGVSRDQIAQFSSRWIEDGSYVRLDNLSIGYNFNTDNITFLSRARLYVTGQNLFVITDYSGFDPEVRTNTNRGNTAPIGIDYLSYPRPRTFMSGASLGF